jgi:acyl-coenzyme A thioesterase PaaI-like protein
MSGSSPSNSLFPITQSNVENVFGYIFAPWVKELGFKDFTVSEGYCSVILPLSSKVRFVTGSMCGQAIMAGVDTASGLASGTTERIGKGTVYQHTHFLSPAANDDYLFKAIVRSFRSSRAYVECDVVSVRTMELVARGVSEFAY